MSRHDPAFYAACQGTHFPDVSRLDWLAALLAAAQEAMPAAESEDPDAEATMFAEVQGLLDDLRAACRAVDAEEAA